MAAKIKKVDVSPATVKIYSAHLKSLSTKAKANLGKPSISFNELIGWFVEQHGIWSSSTINLYRCSIKWALSKKLNQKAIESASTIIATGPTPHGLRLKAINGRPTKRKKFTAAEWQRFQNVAAESKNNWDEFIVDFLKFGLIIVCRPIEIGSMWLQKDTLWIQTAKSNKKRGLDCSVPMEIVAEVLERQVSEPTGTKCRSFDLQNLNPEERDIICRVSSNLPVWVEKKRGWGKFYDALRSRCRVISSKAKIYPSISPSTMRHLCVSAVKANRGSDAASALAGHACTKSTVNHYLRASNSSSMISPAYKIEPDSLALAKLRKSEKAIHPRMRQLVNTYNETIDIEPNSESQKWNGFFNPQNTIRPLQEIGKIKATEMNDALIESNIAHDEMMAAMFGELETRKGSVPVKERLKKPVPNPAASPTEPETELVVRSLFKGLRQ